MPEEKIGQVGRIDVYASECEIHSDGSVNRNKFFYAECGTELFGGEGDEKHLTSLIAIEIKLFAEELGDNLRFVINYKGKRSSIVGAVDGYFGRPTYYASSIWLRRLRRKEQQKLKTAISNLKQKYPVLNLVEA